MAAVKRKRRLAVILTTLGVLLLGCAFGGYRYLDSRSRWAPWVDIEALRARAAQEQPVGGGEGETVAFLRSLGFEDRNIRIQHFAATDPRAGRLFALLARTLGSDPHGPARG